MTAGSVIHEAADEKIEPAVVIEVEPDRARGPVPLKDFGAQASLFADIGERAVAVVVIKNRVAVGGHEDIGEAVVVIVGDRYAHAESAAGYARGFGHVGERAVAIVLVERVANRLFRLEEIAWPAIDQVDVHPTVVVVVQECAAGAHRLRQVMLGRCGVVVDPANPARFRGNFLEEGTRIAGRDGWSKQRQTGAPSGEKSAAIHYLQKGLIHRSTASSIRVRLAGAREADLVIREAGVCTRKFELRHVARHAVCLGDTARLGVLRGGMARGTLTIVGSGAFLQRTMRIVTGGTANARVGDVVASAIGQAVRLKADVEHAARSIHRDLRPGTMALPT